MITVLLPSAAFKWVGVYVKEKDTHILQTPTTATFVCTDYSVHSLVQLISIPHLQKLFG